jgi:VCBS repeat protein
MQCRPAGMPSAASRTAPRARARRRLTLPILTATVASIVAVLPLPAASAFTFSGPANYDVPPLVVDHGLQGVVTADFTGDADPDIAVIHEDPDKVSVLLGGTGGSFTGPTDFALFSHANPLGIALGNFNGDSDPDLVTANEGASDGTTPGNIAVLLGGAGGTFTKPTPYTFSAGEKPQDVAVGDFNGDTDPDLAVANASDSINPNGTVSILLGTAGVNFASPVNYTVGDSPRAVAIGNFDGDSDQDLVVASEANNRVSVLLNTGSGTFTGLTNLTPCSTPNALALGDFNGDSDPDIVAVNEGCNNVSVWLGASGAAFGSRTDFAVGALPDEIAAGDVNGDGLADLAVANQTSDDLSVLLGRGSGSFMPALTFGAADGPSAVAVGQFNGDSRADLVVTNEISNNVSIFLGVQDGYARPKGATPVTFRLVPAFLQCTAPNGSHGAPLDASSCSPPVEASSYLTLNAPDRPAPFNAAAGSSGLVTMQVFCTDGAPSPCTAAAGDQIDVKIDSTITDVRCLGTTGGCSAAGGTYSGKLLLNTGLRITDRQNIPIQEAATAIDTLFQVGMQCASGVCSVSTTADAVIPGIVQEQKRAVWQLSRIEVRDGGSDGNLVAAGAPASGVCPPACAGNGGETLFLHQGIFVP